MAIALDLYLKRAQNVYVYTVEHLRTHGSFQVMHEGGEKKRKKMKKIEILPFGFLILENW